MIGWTRCHYACGCIDEDACVKNPKNSVDSAEQISLRGKEKVRAESGSSVGILSDYSLIPATARLTGAQGVAGSTASTPVPVRKELDKVR